MGRQFLRHTTQQQATNSASPATPDDNQVHVVGLCIVDDFKSRIGAGSARFVKMNDAGAMGRLPAASQVIRRRFDEPFKRLPSPTFSDRASWRCLPREFDRDLPPRVRSTLLPFSQPARRQYRPRSERRRPIIRYQDALHMQDLPPVVGAGCYRFWQAAP